MSRLETKLRSEVFNTAQQLPILCWWEIHNGNINHIFKDKRQPTRNESIILDEIWEGIVCEFIDTIGISKQYTKILEAKKALILLQIKFSKTKDRRLKLFITLAEEKLKELIGDEVDEVNNFEQKAAIEKTMGFQIDGNKTSVIDYYSYIKIIEKQIKTQKDGGK